MVDIEEGLESIRALPYQLRWITPTLPEHVMFKASSATIVPHSISHFYYSARAGANHFDQFLWVKAGSAWVAVY